MCEDMFVYLFGYGSLMWRPGFPYSRKFNAYIKGWKRVFYQGSTDHRGTVENPGRVVTLIKQPEDDKSNEVWLTWGTVYSISDDAAMPILKNLDYREKGGYERHELDVFLEEGDDIEPYGKAIVYLATTENLEFLGEDTNENIANQIFRSIGPSGRNIDYLLKLANSLHDMGVTDKHVFEIERLVLELMSHHKINHHNETIENITDSLLSSSPDKSLELLNQHKRFYSKPLGQLWIDDGAVQAISQRAKSLLPVGIIKMVGEFPKDSLVTILDVNSSQISRGITNYSSDDINLIIGKQSKDYFNTLTGFTKEAVIDHNNLILL
ncbi:hypothetical protein ACTFIV_004964 [Dictyostelium citrinum]